MFSREHSKNRAEWAPEARRERDPHKPCTKSEAGPDGDGSLSEADPLRFLVPQLNRLCAVSVLWSASPGASLGRALGGRDLRTVPWGLAACSWTMPQVNQDQLPKAHFYAVMLPIKAVASFCL